MMPTREPFDPIAILRALDERGVRYVVIGALGRVIHGSPELTDGIDIVPSRRESNEERLRLALDDVDAHPRDGAALALDQPVIELTTRAGQLKLVHEPAGTGGYDDLRRGATREPLGRGVRPSVASLPDHARMLAALGRDRDQETLQTVRRLVELEHQRTRGRRLTRER
jgi:hypothetical protein